MGVILVHSFFHAKILLAHTLRETNMDPPKRAFQWETDHPTPIWEGLYEFPGVQLLLVVNNG